MRNNSDGIVVRTALRALHAANDPVVRIHDGAASYTPSGEREAMEIVLDLDASRLYTASGAFLLVTPFEDPVDQVVDYSLRLQDILDPVLDRYND